MTFELGVNRSWRVAWHGPTALLTSYLSPISHIALPWTDGPTARSVDIL